MVAHPTTMLACNFVTVHFINNWEIGYSNPVEKQPAVTTFSTGTSALGTAHRGLPTAGACMPYTAF